MKKAFLWLAALTVALPSIAILGGCGLFDSCGSKYAKVGDYDSLMAAAGANAKIELTADIDFENKEVTPIALKELNGNGYTIKNAKVLPGINIRNASNTGHYISLLGEYTETVKNVNFSNITVDDSGYARYASIVAAACLEMNNVNVTDCTMTLHSSTFTGGLTCGLKFTKITSDFQHEGKAPENCSIQNSKISVEFDSSSIGGICNQGMIKKSYAKNLIIDSDGTNKIGALVGYGSTLEDCYAENCTVTGKTYATDSLSPIYVGGLAGDLNFAKRCYIKNCTVYANAPYYSKSIFGVDGVATAYAGGIAGKMNGSFENCYASDNKVSAFCSGNTFVGGLAGAYISKVTSTLNQSYTVNNDIKADGRAIDYRADKYSAMERATGGLIGYAQNLTISNCYAYNNSVQDATFEIKYDYYGKSYCYAGGLAGNITGESTISKCAVKSKKVLAFDSGDSAHFIGNTKLQTSSCYKDFSDEQWTDGKTVPEAIGLTGDYWSIQDGKLPELNFDSKSAE